MGPAVLGWASGGSELKLLSSIGISVLLFVVGLKLDVSLIRSVGPVALATGLGQIVFTSLFGFLLALGLGFAPMKAIHHGLQTAGFQGHFIATAHDEAEVAKLEFLGAQRTLLPFLDAAVRAAEVIVEDLVDLRAQRGIRAA